MQIDTSTHSLPVFQALANETRLTIIDLLGKNEMNIRSLAAQLNLSSAIITRHIKQLEDAGIVKTRRLPGKSGLQKLASLSIDYIGVSFPEKIFPEYRSYLTEIKIGHYTDYLVEPTCGLATSESIIGDTDQPRYFLDSERVDAELIWLGKGFVEYKIPNIFHSDETVEFVDISFEISSEFPISNNTWPSDITYYINGIKLGTDTISGNFSDVRGRITPDWWPDMCSQYGLLKHIRINHFDTGIDAVPISSVNIKDLHLEEADFFTFRIASEADAKNVGGLTLFGKKWGNHPQNIKVLTYVS